MRRFDWFFGLAAACLVGLLGCSSNEAESPTAVNVSGVIKDDQGNPLANTVVTFSGPAFVEIKTDGEGRFSDIKAGIPDKSGDGTQTGLPEGNYDVRTKGHPSGELVGFVEVKAGKTEVEIKMKPAPNPTVAPMTPMP